MRRKRFLTLYLGALGAQKIAWNKESESSISGTVLYELDDPEETQDFIWHKMESEIPPKDVESLVELLCEQKLLSLDKITVCRQTLKKLYCNKVGRIISEVEFQTTFEALMAIEVSMVDDGRETDVFFIHD
ncbi:hypothetical protein H4F20_20175 [Vibrio sp. 16]|uniref:hypothetical protein n=1 Tax=Vibrio sp. 16 TaxID=391586 RepID=UPI002FF209B5